MRLDMLQLLGPSAVVHPECFGSTSRRNLVEPRLDDREPGVGTSGFEVKLDKRGGLARIVQRRVNRIRVPPVSKVLPDVHADDERFELEVFVTGERDVPLHALPLNERTLEMYPKPGAKFLR